MFLIGVNNTRLKLSIGLFVLFASLFFSNAHAELSRELKEPEIEKLRQNVSLDPKNWVARRFLIDHYLKKRDWPKMIELAQPVQKELPGDYQIELIKAYLEVKDGEGALAVTGFYHGKNPPTAETKIFEGFASRILASRDPQELTRKKKAIGVIEIFKDATRLDPENPTPYLAWIETLRMFWSNYADDALQVYKKLESATGDTTTYLSERCELFVLASLWDQALNVCQRSIEHNKEHISSYIFLSKAEAVKLGSEAAKKTLIRLVTDHPDSALAHKTLADNYFLEKNFVSASDQYRKAVALDPKDTTSYLSLAQSEFQLKKFPEALEAYKKHCNLSRTVASEFKNAAGQLRSNYPLHLKYKNVMTSCQ